MIEYLQAFLHGVPRHVTAISALGTVGAIQDVEQTRFEGSRVKYEEVSVLESV